MRVVRCAHIFGSAAGDGQEGWEEKERGENFHGAASIAILARVAIGTRHRRRPAKGAVDGTGLGRVGSAAGDAHQHRKGQDEKDDFHRSNGHVSAVECKTFARRGTLVFRRNVNDRTPESAATIPACSVAEATATRFK